MRVKDRVLYADEGMRLTNGTACGTVVVLAVGADPSQWREITAAEAEEMEQVPAAEALRELREVLV